ncbi:MAG: hypothetical protein CL535_13585 [Ahrensia sp.]|nr:hypothetical protein [Ahrensia sp.]
MENGFAFDWKRAIDRNFDVLECIVLRLLAMAGVTSLRPVVDTLPRYLRFRILAILRPAEFATRRLIAVAACKLDLDVGPMRPRGGTDPRSPTRREDEKAGAKRKQAETAEGRGGDPVGVKIPAFALFDPFKPFGAPWLTPEEIAALDKLASPALFVPARPPHEPVDARALCLRIAALRNALADFDGHALRLARWRARRAAGWGRPVRLSPFRPGFPPGWVKRPKTEIGELLKECHSLGLYAWTVPDTS